MQLSEIIIKKIRAEGPLSFRDYMEHCLYYPDLGYYTSPGDKIGKAGDFYTSSSISNLLGAMIGRQLEEMWVNTGKNDFTVVEFGAGTGMLCKDILDYLKGNKEMYDRTEYRIIEKSAAMREREQQYLKEKVQWCNSITELKPMTGCVLSNELLDNLAVHVVVMEEELKEVFVDYKDGFTEVLKPADNKLQEYFSQLGVTLPRGFRTEVNLEATEWIKEISLSLEKGYVITIDYGSVSDQLYREAKSNGTMLCFHKHTINDQPYINIGEQDITTHVNFSALSFFGERLGLETCGLTNQANFMLGLGFEEYLNKMMEGKRNYLDFKRFASLKYNLLVDMGQKFKVLIQSKGVVEEKLKGLQ